MKLIWKYTLVIALLSSCTQKEVDDKPVDLIDVPKMTQIMTDVHLIEGARTGLTVLGDTTYNIADYYEAMYKKHGITEDIFESSFTYYTQHPEVMDKMYEKVIEDLTVIETELKASQSAKVKTEPDYDE